MKKIDVHSHIFPDEIAPKVIDYLQNYYGFKWGGSGILSDLISSMDSAEVERSVIFSSATKPEQVVKINSFIASTVDAHPERFIGFGTIHPDFEDYENEIERIKKLGLRGIKLHPDFQGFNIDDPRMMRIYDAVGDSLVFLFHTGDKNTDFSSPYRLANLNDKMPFLRIIAAHLGGYSEWDESYKHLVGRDIFMDVSSVFPHISYDEGRKLILAHGIEKTLFASDYPAIRHNQAVSDVVALGFADDENEKIFHLNASKLLGV